MIYQQHIAEETADAVRTGTTDVLGLSSSCFYAVAVVATEMVSLEEAAAAVIAAASS